MEHDLDPERTLALLLAHPLRYAALAQIGDRPAGPAAVSAELDAPLNTIAYHLHQLHDAGLLVVDDRRHERGAPGTVYRLDRARVAEIADAAARAGAVLRLLTGGRG